MEKTAVGDLSYEFLPWFDVVLWQLATGNCNNSDSGLRTATVAAAAAAAAAVNAAAAFWPVPEFRRICN